MSSIAGSKDYMNQILQKVQIVFWCTYLYDRHLTCRFDKNNLYNPLEQLMDPMLNVFFKLQCF